MFYRVEVRLLGYALGSVQNSRTGGYNLHYHQEEAADVYALVSEGRKKESCLTVAPKINNVPRKPFIPTQNVQNYSMKLSALAV